MSSKFTNNIESLLFHFRLNKLNSQNYKNLYNFIKKNYGNSYKITKKREYYMKKKHSNECLLINIIKIMKNENVDFLNNIVNKLNESETQKRQIFTYLANIDKIRLESSVIWFNINGKSLIRSICNLLEDKKLPKNILNKIQDSDININNEFVSLDIQHYCETCINLRTQLEIINNNRNKIRLTINSNKKYDLEKLIFRCCLLSNIHNMKDDLKINIWLTDKKKKISNNYKNLGPKEINSGSSGGIENYVNIWRVEEVYKVLIHEIYHNLNLDTKHNKYSNLIRLIYNVSDINSKILINEALVEIIANISNCAIISLELNQDYNKFLYYLELERKFSIFQIAKILIHFGYKSASNFFFSERKKYIFKQNTSVFSYFIVKGAILFNLDIYMDIINNQYFYDKLKIEDLLVMSSPNNLKSPKIRNMFNDILAKLGSVKNESSLNSLINNLTYFEHILFRLIYNNDFINVIDIMMKELINKKIRGHLWNSLRMTCVSN